MLPFLLLLFKLPEGVVLATLSLLVFGFLSQEESVSVGFSLDSVSWAMVSLSLLVGSIVIMTSSSVKSSSKSVFSFLSILVVVFFFLTDNIFLFFILFEMSLIPLMFLVLTWGHQAERLLASQFMLVYTIVASAPLLFFILWVSSDSHSSSINLLSLSLKSYGDVFLVCMLAFLVKIPIFFFHSWLPKAHVEAPLEGSMILAGIMLKVGVYGMLRMMMITHFPNMFLEILLSVSLIGSLSSSLLALSSDDMKMSVAFSSISHMNMAVGALLSMKMSGFVAVVVVMIAHGICSPLLFYLVTKIYSFTHSRSVLISKGAYSKIPFLWFLGMMVWIMNISPPPFFSFLGEIMGFSSILSLIPLLGVWVVVFLVISSFYSIVNFGVQSHSSFKLPFKGSESDLIFPLFSLISIILSVLMFISPPLIYL